MHRLTWQQLVSGMSSLEGAVIALWSGLAVLTIALFVLSRTRWGQERPLRKCLVLSVLAHVLFIGYATTVRIVAGIPRHDPEPVVHISLDDGNPWDTNQSQTGADLPSPWASHHHDAPADLEPLKAERAAPAAGDDDSPRRHVRDEGLTPLSPLDRIAMLGPVHSEPDAPPEAPTEEETASAEAAAPIDAPQPQRRDATKPRVPSASPQRAEAGESSQDRQTRESFAEGVATSLLRKHAPLPSLRDVPVSVEPNRAIAAPEDSATSPQHGRPANLEDSLATSGETEKVDLNPSTPSASADTSPPSLADAAAPALSELASVSPLETGSDAIGPPVLGQARREPARQEVPRVYRLRVAPNRSELARRYGATSESEAAVRAALKWLADNQEGDGRWNPMRHSGGKERRVHGRDRFGAGAKADTGISALALLAFLASGHTHEEGLYRKNVRRGLEFLIRSQGSDGSLGGRASTYAFMYCHAMAAFALSEAYGMTGDRALEGPVRRAVTFTVTAQNPTTGGWRYNLGDEGDTSQLGWQLMALKSAELAGIPMPAHTRQGAIRYLENVSSGRFGGLAAYRPVESPSRPMTAEALASRHFLGIPPDSVTAKESAEYLLEELPGDGQANFYYWYYATLGLCQTQSDAWDQWNAALQRELLALQRNSGRLAGSWDPDTVWGGYGGRVYTTALAALCLEVYYRFMPLYVEAASVGRTLR